MIQTRRTTRLNDVFGQTMIEYVFILVLIVAVVIVAIPPLATVTMNFFTNFSNAFGG